MMAEPSAIKKIRDRKKSIAGVAVSEKARGFDPGCATREPGLERFFSPTSSLFAPNDIKLSQLDCWFLSVGRSSRWLPRPQGANGRVNC
jgi:hypothetical protein